MLIFCINDYKVYDTDNFWAHGGQITYYGKTYYPLHEPEPDDDDYYTASALCTDGYLYNVDWKILSSSDPEMGSEYACNWDRLCAARRQERREETQVVKLALRADVLDEIRGLRDDYGRSVTMGEIIDNIVNVATCEVDYTGNQEAANGDAKTATRTSNVTLRTETIRELEELRIKNGEKESLSDIVNNYILAYWDLED